MENNEKKINEKLNEEKDDYMLETIFNALKMAVKTNDKVPIEDKKDC